MRRLSFAQLIGRNEVPPTEAAVATPSREPERVVGRSRATPQQQRASPAMLSPNVSTSTIDSPAVLHISNNLNLVINSPASYQTTSEESTPASTQSGACDSVHQDDLIEALQNLAIELNKKNAQLEAERAKTKQLQAIIDELTISQENEENEELQAQAWENKYRKVQREMDDLREDHFRLQMLLIDVRGQLDRTQRENLQQRSQLTKLQENLPQVPSSSQSQVRSSKQKQQQHSLQNEKCAIM